MWRWGLLVVALLLLGTLLFGTAVLARQLVFEPTPGDIQITRQYQQSLTRDPAHAALYTRIYTTYRAITNSDQTRYIIHRAAGKVAALTGHPKAAQVQYARAWAHRPGKRH